MATINDYSDDRKKLMTEIAGMESSAINVTRPELPEVKLTELSYSAPTDAELKATAEAGLAGYKRESEAAIRADSENSAAALKAKRDGYASDLSGSIEKLTGDYETAARNIDNDVIKRGLARSSIAAVGKSALEADYAKKAAELRAEYGGKISDIDAEIAAVDSKLRTALDDFNLAYAAKLGEKLAALKAERDEKVTAVIKYNNDVRAKQAALDADREKTVSSLYSEALSQRIKENSLDALTPEQREQLYGSVYAKMDEYLASLTPEDAKLEIRNHTLFRDHLSDYYYSKLYNKYGR